MDSCKFCKEQSMEDYFDYSEAYYTDEDELIGFKHVGSGEFRILCEDCCYNRTIFFNVCPMCGRTLR